MVIYKTTNLVNGKVYVGKDMKNDPLYMGSGKLLRSAICKYGEENFVKEILEVCEDAVHLSSRESYWIEQLSSIAPNGYNLAAGGNGGNTRKGFSDEEYANWLHNKSSAQNGKRSFWKDKPRPDHSSAMKKAHEDSKFGNYEWLKRSRVAKTVDKLGWPKGKPRQTTQCQICGRVVARSVLKRHQNGSNCKEG